MASTSTAVNLPTNCCYEVFLNHRGPDTKNTLASYLYRRLVLHGFRVFWDKQEMRVGDALTSQIQHAIKTAYVHVAIFSARYAESKWCLDELQLMVESEKPIIPVFYNIHPCELRRTQGEGVYAEAIRNLEKRRTHDSQPRYDSATIENWRTALSTVAGISGLELERFNGDEGELVDAIVDSVSQKLRGTRRLDVAEHPTGLDEKIEDFEKKVLLVQRQQSDKPRVIGIVGMGGIGKTTLVKEIFNRKKCEYSRSCFLSDVRENARKASLESLQKKLLEGLTQRDERIGSVSEGIELLRTRLSSLQVLVILDDVDHVNHLDALLRPIRDVIHSNSLVLITSRDRDVLRRSRVEDSSLYKLTGLSPQHSEELFCLHAFTQPHPPPGFEDLVDKYLKACNQLPLSLKVFGGLLYGNDDKSFWEDHLERLEQILPEDIQKSLQISYDALQMDEKKIFLDIACFFLGKRRYEAIQIWDGCGLRGSLGFRSLLNKNLVELEDVEYHLGFSDRETEVGIRMHDQVRDLGRHLANDPGLPRRIWRTEDFENLLQQSSVVTVEVRSISLCWQRDEVPSFSGCKIRNLQLLDIDRGFMKSIMKAMQSPNLMWLRTGIRTYSRLASWFPLTKLRVLKVSSEWPPWSLQPLWHEESQAPLQLRELTIRGPLFVIPKNIRLLNNLERIVISNSKLYMEGLDKLPKEFGEQHSLKHWEGPEKLPKEFCELLSLKHLKMISCRISSLPDSFGNLTNLKHIDMSYCSDLKRLPDSFGNLTNLKHIDLSGCSDLESLPDSFGNLTRLEYLDLHGCSALTMARETLGNICTLQYIDLTGCSSIEVLPSQLAHQWSLEILDLTDLESLIELPSDIGELRSLKNLKLWNSKKLKGLPDSLGRLKQLTELLIINCSLCQLSFKMVEGEVESICPSLQRLHIIGCDALVEVGRLPDALIDLKLAHCPNLREIEWLSPLSKLQLLNLSECRKLEQLPSIETLVSLEEIEVFGCVKLRSIRGLAHLTKLRRLDVWWCYDLKELAGVEHLRALERLNVCDCPNLQLPEGVSKDFINISPFPDSVLG